MEAKKNIKLSFFIPQEGSLIWFDNLYIPKDAPHVANAHRFIEFLLQPQTMAKVTDYIHYANSNAAATALVREEIRQDPAIYPDAQTRERLFAQKTQSPKDMRAITRVWSTVKTGF